MGVLAKIASRPAVREAAGVLVNIAVDRIKERRKGGSVTPSSGEQATMVNEAAEAIARRPELVNAMNAEHPLQSRILIGLATASIGFALDKFEVGAENKNFVLANLPLFIEAAGLLFAFFGRLVKGLKPLSWFGLASRS